MAGATFIRTKPTTGFENLDQARQRLENTIVVHNGQGYYVASVASSGGNQVGHLAALPCNYGPSRSKQPTTEVFRLDDPLFNRFRPFELGFANIFDSVLEDNTHTMFFHRRPMRSGARQGLSRDAIDGCYLLNGNLKLGGGSARMEGLDFTAHIMPSQGFANMIRGVYPTFQECVEGLIEDSSLAFDRNYAVHKDYDGLVWVYRQFEKVGLVNPTSREFFLFSRKKFLREEIQESGKFPTIQAEI